MSNNYYAGQCYLQQPAQRTDYPGQSVCTADDEDCKGFFSEQQETEENYTEATGKASEKYNEAQGFQKELFHFVHPALDEDDESKYSKEVERLVKQFNYRKSVD